jgi:integrase
VSIYFERRRRPERSDERSKLAVLERFAIDRFGTVGAMPLAAITEDVLEQFVVALKRDGFAQSTLNKYITVTKALFAWATKKKYLSVNPAGDSDILARATHAKRTRRLAPDVLDEKGQLREAGEERRLLAEAGPSLQRIIIAGLESGCRRGELLALQWRDVHLQKREVFIRAEEAGAQKTGTARRLPISTRLAGVFEMARAALVVPEGLTGEALAQHVATCYVFGDEAGRKLARIVKAWETCVLKAHGITPAWTNSHALTPECRAALDAIDLHFHDLRHEAGSRLLEAGWPLHHVQHMLGHSNIATTSTYLNAHVVGLAESMKRLDASRCNSVANEAPIEHRPELQRRDPEAAKALVQ